MTAAEERKEGMVRETRTAYTTTSVDMHTLHETILALEHALAALKDLVAQMQPFASDGTNIQDDQKAQLQIRPMLQKMQARYAKYPSFNKALLAERTRERKRENQQLRS